MSASSRQGLDITKFRKVPAAQAQLPVAKSYVFIKGLFINDRST